MIDHQYLLLALAIILVITNCIGAAFTFRRNAAESQRSGPGPRSAIGVSFGWSTIYGRLAVAQGLAVMFALGATALNFSHSIAKFFGSLF